ncbi:WD40-repeat-containing domain protein [Gymnopilus junonius]|uniref:Pre-mRNA-processing factor 19 n=1 Tax=Gymnopilus junonius TaxID=109634 RepID=A0A9P5TQS7_GYMJU|nr:WD40-repeat-containing domain protein [Gymnopilus junonius]
MSFFCAISGEPPQEPVVSTKSHNVYERRLIVKYINENGTDPITGEKTEESDLIPIKASPETAAPRPPTHTSIPALLTLLQNEYDALVLGTYNLEQKYNATRQELSYSLYAQDAASRVVARLIRERDAAREALANVQASMGIAPSAGAVSEDVDMGEAGSADAGLPANVVAQIDETHQALSAARKKRKPAPGYASPAEVKTFVATHTIPSLHSASPAGITSLALSQTNPSQFLTGGNDKVVQLYDRSTDKVLASLKGHTKKVNQVAFRERDGDSTLLLSAGGDKIAKVWAHDTASGEYIPKLTVRSHKGELTGLAVHPTSTLFALSSTDKTYSLHDLTTFAQIFRSAPSDEAFTSLAIHPDGTLLGLGTPTSTIQIYDVRTGAIAASLTPPDSSPFTVNTLAFSENGYHLLAPDSLSSVAVWDLRKQKTTHSIPLGDDGKINRVLYDTSAQFLGVATSQGARVYAHKTWEELLRLEEGGEVSDFAFGALGKEIWGATGREVRVWGLPSA